jgi:enoyl-CoA hydratase
MARQAMNPALQYEVDDAGLAVVRLARRHGNAIDPQLVEGLLDACSRAAADPAVRGMRLCAAGKLFCPGLDLQDLSELDRPAMERFVRRFGECVHALYGFPKPAVAQIHGHAMAGGLVLALTADWRVLAAERMLGLAELRVGLPFPHGVACLLRETVDPRHLAEVVLLGRNYSGDEAVEVGLAHEVAPAEELDARCRRRLADLAARDLAAFATTKRYLRGEVLERMREGDRRHAGEFLDAWFSAPTRERIRGVVAALREK